MKDVTFFVLLTAILAVFALLVPDELRFTFVVLCLLALCAVVSCYLEQRATRCARRTKRA